MNAYFITWAIDIMADTPEDAARLALEIQRDPESTAVFFTVRDLNGDEGELIEVTEQVTK